MNRDIRAWIPAILAALLFVIVAGQTVVAFQQSGRWNLKRAPRYLVNSADPYNRLERVLSEPNHPPALAGLRDPFTYVRSGVTTVRPTHTGPVGPAPPVSRPVLTAIVTDPTDPRAIVVYENHNYSVRAGDLFAEFRVVSITAEGVVLDNGRERLTLQRPTKGK
jgi:hypothetical protein